MEAIQASAPDEIAKGDRTERPAGRSLPARLLLAGACGLALALPFTIHDGSLPAWLVLAPVFWLVAQAPTAGVAALLATGFALAWTLPSFSFLGPLTPPGMVAVALYTSVFYVAGLLIVRRLARWNAASAVFGIAAVWTLIELLRSMIPVFGFPWLLLGHTLLYATHLRQGADLFGVYGLSFLIAAANAALAFALPAWLPARQQAIEKRSAAMALVIVAALLAADFVYGLAQVSRLTPRLRAGAPIALIQGNVAQKLGRTNEELYAQLLRHLELHRQVVDQARADGQPPVLVCWAETMVPVDLHTDEWGALFKARVRQSGVPTLTGSEHKQPGADVDQRDFNAAFVLDADAQELGRYFKRRLVPFGEYVPFTGILPFLKILQSITRDQYEPGTAASPVIDLGGYRMAMNLCIEDIHPDLAREAVADGADALVNLTNDGWFYGTFGPRAHLQAAAWRAIEVRRPLLRVTNTGQTVAVDPLGTIQVLIPPETEGVCLVRLLRLEGDAGGTLSARCGEWGVLALLALVLLVCWRTARRDAART